MAGDQKQQHGCSMYILHLALVLASSLPMVVSQEVKDFSTEVAFTDFILEEPMSKHCDLLITFQESRDDGHTILKLAAEKGRAATLMSGSKSMEDSINFKTKRCILNLLFVDRSFLDEYITKITGLKRTRMDFYYVSLGLTPDEISTVVAENHYTFKIMNLIFAHPLAEDPGKMRLLTHCRFCAPGSQVRLVDIWRPGPRGLLLGDQSQSQSQLFPGVIRDCLGGTLTLAHGYSAVPLFDVVKLRNGTGLKLGSELSALRYLGERFNFKLNMVRTIDNKWGAPLTRNLTGKWNGMIGMLQREEAEAAAAQFGISFSRSRVVDYSMTHDYNQMSGMTFVTLASGFLPKWQALYWPLDNTVWIMLITSLLTFGLVLYVFMFVADREVSKKYTFTKSYMESIQVFFGKGKSNLPNRSVIRIFLSGWMFFCMLITLAYSSMLMACLTLPAKTKPMNTFEELAKSGYKVAGRAGVRYFNLLQENENDPVLGAIHRQIMSQDPEETFYEKETLILPRLANEPELAILGSVGIATTIKANLHTENIRFEELHMAFQRLFSSGRAFPMQRASPLLHTFNEGMITAIEMGLLIKWENNFYKQLQDLRLEGLVPPGPVTESLESSEGSTVLVLSHLQGAFFIYFIGILLGVLGFVWERISWCFQGSRFVDGD